MDIMIRFPFIFPSFLDDVLGNILVQQDRILPNSSAHSITTIIILKGKVKVKFALEQVMNGQRERRGIALLFL